MSNPPTHGSGEPLGNIKIGGMHNINRDVVGEIAVRLGKDGKLKTGYRLLGGPWKDADDLFAKGDADGSTPPLPETPVSGFVREDA